MKNVIKIAILALTMGCTAQQRARSFGGSDTVNLPAGQMLVTATWKEAHLWYLTKAAPAGHRPETVTFQESSAYGMFQGTVLFVEH